MSESIVGEAHVAQISADERRDILVMGGSSEQVAAFVAEIERTQPEAPDVLSRTPTGAIVRCRNPPGGVTATLAAAGATVLWPAVWRDGEEAYTVIAPSREAFAAILAALRPLGDVRAERITAVAPEALPFPSPLADLAARLTRRQADALRLAGESGYFEIPRRVGLDELARSFGVARSTYEEHLQKATSEILRRVSLLLAEREGRGTKGPGRPLARERSGRPRPPSL